ncbi:MAG TPA: inorganic phosphate transporter [Bacteroidales bacterium]|jgi:Na+/phosphate symporter|nr:inorganic phosphate transporter [Bacteroidales bacterium]HNU22015.1 inorganic phosphate transporter [Bacteroidales bacterium]HNZ79577.1 inorganic phosphate transporter [Bacteroidales bacterium]HOC15998.1 inorganic phosphate transporter [Bacteroidales bacterium]HOX79791.1 inorganic phosphate transporter [Bacteroidales bacterium]
MESLYIIIVGFLFLLAIVDLIVGVGNDAVNFLNSAVGSKAAPFKIILAVAFVGVVTGTLFSSGMMEIARSGIFNPSMFYFNEVMYIFLAVMITDIVMLDAFNNLGLPTSTTVSLIFELLGASVAVAVMKTIIDPMAVSNVAEYLNTAKVLAIIAGILLSVVIAFFFGTVIQYISRLLFTFRYKQKLPYLGGIWGGISFTIIIYFLILKGIRGAAFIDETTIHYIESHTATLMLLSIVGFTIIFQLLMWLFKINVLKIVVLTGTFALAMAFAGNDLVNFIGVPVAGYESYRIYIQSGVTDPNSLFMGALAQPIKSPWYFLFIAGIIMGLTLIFSRKARAVTNTEVSLSRQEEGLERFSPNPFSRNIVRMLIRFGNTTDKILPEGMKKFIASRLTPPDAEEMKQAHKAGISYDLVRASVNLVVSSALIAYGTSHKLPLSTTYVTFMVAMGSSFADGAWGRESAVYRVSGVMTVIAGWFLTAFIAFSVAFILATIIFFGKIPAIVILMILAALMLIHQQKVFVRKEKEAKIAQEILSDDSAISAEKMIARCNNDVLSILKTTDRLYTRILVGLFKEDRKKLKAVQAEVDEFNKRTKLLKSNVHNVVEKLKEDDVETGHFYVQVVDFMREIAHCINYISEPALNHVENNHKGLLPSQKAELTRISAALSELIHTLQHMIETCDLEQRDKIVKLQQQVNEYIDKARKDQVKRIKNHETGTKNSLLYLNILAETKNLSLFILNLYKSHRDFVVFSIGHEMQILSDDK